MASRCSHKLAMISVSILVVAAVAVNGASSDTDEMALRGVERAVRFFRTELSCQGGYLGEYSEDLETWIGEGTEAPSRIWIQPPGTPSVGQTYLRAYEVTGDQRYLEAAIAVADALIFGQMECGGWRYVVDFLGEDKYRYRHEENGDPDDDNRVTFDDDVTQSAIRMLMAVDAILDRDPYTDATMYALDFMIESQFPNGAWPQVYPLSGNYPNTYSDFYTFNDAVINDCIDLMLEAYRAYGDERYLRSAERGGSFIIISQIEEPQAGWAQQYTWDLEPAWARSFEPPAVCSAVTGRNIETLLELYLFTGNETYLDPIPAAVDWLNNSTIGENMRARFYELGTNRPIYGDRDGEIHYTLEEISEERQTGYGWQGSYGSSAIRMYERVMEKGREEYLADRNRQLTPQERADKAESLEPTVVSLLTSMDEGGRWVSDGWIYSKEFNRNMDRILSYLDYRDLNITPPDVPRFPSVRLNLSGESLLVEVEVAHPAGLGIDQVILRVNPWVEGMEFSMLDDSSRGDRTAADGVHSALIGYTEEIANSIYEAYIVCEDEDGHWNLTAAPLGILAEIYSLMEEIDDRVYEADGMGLDLEGVASAIAGIRSSLGTATEEAEMESILNDARELSAELEREVVWSLIELAAEVIERAKNQGMDTSRHEIFLGQARAQYEKGNYGSARQFTEYPLRLVEDVGEIYLWLIPVLLAMLGWRSTRGTGST